jgi:hypothetical protein
LIDALQISKPTMKLSTCEGKRLPRARIPHDIAYVELGA